MKKRIAAIMLCLIMAAAFTACGSPDDTASVPSPTTPAATVSPSPSASPDVMPEGSPSASPSASPDVSGDAMGETQSLDAYAKAVKDTYAGDYIPDRMLTDDEISERLGLTTDMYDDIYAEGSTLEENPDIFVAVKAKSGKADAVKTKLEDYRDKLATNTDYSANVDKIKAGQVHVEGDHVFLFLLGKNDFAEDAENLGDRFADEVKRGVDAVKNMFTPR